MHMKSTSKKLITYYLTIGLLCLTIAKSNGQEHRKFQVGAGFAFTPTVHDDISHFSGIYLEPTIRYTEGQSLSMLISTINTPKQKIEQSINNTLYSTNVQNSLLSSNIIYNRYIKAFDNVKGQVGLGIGYSRYEEEGSEILVNNGQARFTPYTIRSRGISLTSRAGLNFGNFYIGGLMMIHNNGLPYFIMIQSGFIIGGGRKKAKNPEN